MNLFSHFCSALLIVSLVSCQGTRELSEVPSGAQPLTHTLIDQGAYSSIETPMNVWIEDYATFSTLWEQMHKNQTPTLTAPEVDFSAQAVVASFMGMKPNGGHTARISLIAIQDGKAYVVVQQVSPGPDCFTTDAITYPFIMAAVNRSAIKDHQFIVQSSVNNCE